MPAIKTAPEDQTESQTESDRIAALEELIRKQSEQINGLQARPVGKVMADYPEPLGLRPKDERQAHGREIVSQWEQEAREAERDAE